ncbi:MAG: sigma-54-dependent Fis family transcriptional regulator [Deltaproteobacteria bacterium]|nr:sigma-54-dependent Fis family transcriptional regulator [Deltaproteobacteria bacterium]MBW2129557.1 sigma-54-dependent Fis family transcriptional regulator [Deltaproteobacteria bacterium]MBW2302771.1 sigma-54-dependent Fis family transcriptional regulator [Deltaproteobacteria bacterium]
MPKTNRKKILWTVRDFAPPKSLWDRLEEMDMKVLLADPGEDPLEKIQKSSPALWVAQTNGGSADNLAMLDKIRSTCPDLPIVVMSTAPSVEEAVKILKMGIRDYIPKGASEEQIRLSVEGVLGQSLSRKSFSRPKMQGQDDSQEAPIAVDSAMKKILALARKVAGSRTTILIQGESGTGKEVLARYIHRCSNRKEAPFVAVNCSALPETLLESELFGHERGAFTGAVARKKGKFELADGGTLLLDEISEMDISIQAKLLRVLQEREVDRVGGQFPVPVDTRVIATTNRDLESETKKGRFRLDLFYRLNVIPLRLPPLRDRPDDIVPLANHFLERHCSLNGISQKRLTPEGEKFLKERGWPGNVRELENLMERATLLVESDQVGRADLEEILGPGEDESVEFGIDRVLPLKDMEKRMIFRALNDHGGNRTHAARVLGISVRTLRNKLNEYQEELKRSRATEESPQGVKFPTGRASSGRDGT